MALSFKFDVDKNLYQNVLKHFLSTSEIAEIVDKASEVGYNYIYNQIPHDTGQGRSHFIKSPVRIYPNQTWLTLKFEGDFEEWAYLIYLNYNPSSDHWHWFEDASREAKKLIKKELAYLAEAKIRAKN